MREARHSTATGLGLGAIVAYKLTKSVVELIFGATLLLLRDSRWSHGLQALAEAAREHAVEAWSIALANLLVKATTSKYLDLIAAASLFDALLSAVEGWSLHRRYWWGHWLIIIATSALLPLEVARLLHRFALGRAVILLANLAIVGFLIRRRIANHQSS